MGKVINPNLKHLRGCLIRNSRGAILEGSSRSGKTWSSVDFIVYLCSNNKGLVINIVRETYNSFKTTLYNDFAKRLDMIGIPNPFSTVQDIAQFNLFGNKINFIGADKAQKYLGAGCDYFYINEALDVKRDVFDQLEMRCRKFWWMDYNPSAVSHWIYDSVIPRKDVEYLKTTWRSNPFITQQERNKILSYEPTEENKTLGTADEYNWKVFGLGERTAKTGAIFPDYTVVDNLPDSYDTRVFGLDFGYSVDPASVIEMRKDGNNVYIEEVLYETHLLNEQLFNKIKERVGRELVIADSAEPKSIAQLKQLGLRIRPVEKGKDSINYGINLLKEKRIHITKKSVNLLKEIQEYSYEVKRGEVSDKPVDDFNHAIDAMRYAGMYLLRKRREIV